MHRFRGQWLALFGGILLLTLSVSTVFGARPEGADGNRGQTISSFVHSVVFGDETGDETGDEELTDEELTDEELTDQELVEEELVEDGEASAHGECVSAVAQDKEAIGGPNDNHGGAVSEAARVACRDDSEAEEEVVEEGSESEAVSTEVVATDADAETTADRPGKGHGRDKANHPDKGGGRNHGRGHR